MKVPLEAELRDVGQVGQGEFLQLSGVKDMPVEEVAA